MRIKKKNHICLICKEACYGLRYCSYCYSTKAQLGRIPWNKGIKTGIIPKTAFKKGIRFNPSGEFKKGIGKHFMGEIKEYKAIHAWLSYNLGRPHECSNCKSINNLDWANKSQEYKRDLTDWLALCRKCHFKYDRIYE